MPVVLARDLDEVVEAPGAGDQVGDLGQGGELLAGLFEMGLVDGDAEHADDLEPELERVGDCHDLHHAVGRQTGNPLPDRGFRYPEVGGDPDVGAAAVAHQGVDDLVVEMVEH